MPNSHITEVSNPFLYLKVTINWHSRHQSTPDMFFKRPRPSSIFQSIWLCYHSRDTGYLEKQVYRVIPKIPWILGQVYTIYALLVFLCPIFHPVLLYGQPFCVAANLDKCEPNDPKIAFNTTRQMVPCLFVTSAPEFQISISITVRPAIFNIRICQNSQMHEMTLEWPSNLNSEKYLMYTKDLLSTQLFWKFSYMRRRFQDTRLPKIPNAPNHLRITPSTYLLNVLCSHHIISISAQMLSVSL